MKSSIKPVLAIMFLVSLVYASASEASMDILVTKGVDNATPEEGDVVTYTITVTNVGDISPLPVPGVSIIDELPEEGLTDISFDAGGSMDFEGNVVWSLPSLFPGSSVELTITASVNGTAGDIVTNRAKLGGVFPPDQNESNNAASAIMEIQQEDLYLEIDIDIKPGNEDNSINLKSKGVIPVAILTTADFDATTVDPSSVRFGKTGTEAAPMHEGGHIEDVDGDGDNDLLFHFSTQETGLQEGDTEAYLTGKLLTVQSLTARALNAEVTSNSQPISGCDAVKTSKKAPGLGLAGKVATTWGSIKNRY